MFFSFISSRPRREMSDQRTSALFEWKRREKEHTRDPGNKTKQKQTRKKRNREANERRGAQMSPPSSTPHPGSPLTLVHVGISTSRLFLLA